MRIIRFKELATVPWKNGGGITREIASKTVDASLVWRLSMADVDSDGTFSNFAGLTRILTVIEGNGLRLVGPNGTFEAAYGEPVIFDGGLPIESKLLNGPVRDLNVMFDSRFCVGSVALAKAPMHFNLADSGKRTIAVVGLQGESALNNLEPICFGDVALLEIGSIELSLAKTASALIVTLDIVG
jgi:uncharacterized protein